MHERLSDDHEHAAACAPAPAPHACPSSGCACGTEKLSPSKLFWRSLDDKAGTDEVERWRHHEFQEGASELDGDDRRSFLKVMGASMALAGAAAVTGCRRLPEQHIREYASRPEGRVPGTPVTYATSWELDGVGLGLVVTAFDGRPTKVDGNPLHPGLLGSSDSITQATILEMYDPERSRAPLHKGQPSTMTAFRAWWTAQPRDGLAILSEPSSSVSRADLKARLLAKYPGARWFEWSPVNADNERQGTESVFGAPMRPLWKLDEARIIVALDSDFLLTHPNAVRNARDFANGRRIANPDASQQAMSRLYAIESALTVTGMNADERVALRSSDIAALAAMIARGTGVTVGDAAEVALAAGDRAVIDALVQDLKENRGRSLVIAGAGQPAAVHALAAAMNEALGNVGSTITYVPAGAAGTTALGDIGALAQAMNQGAVSTLVVLGGNPIYDAPADLQFGAALAKVPAVVHLSFHRNETTMSAACTWHVPQAHYLESWGDTRGYDGTLAPQQPIMDPLLAADMGGLSAIEMCALLLDEEPRDGMGLVRRAWTAALALEGNAFESAWRTALNDGVVAGSAWPTQRPTANAANIRTAAAPAAKGFELTFAPDTKVHDGRFANVAWLQELPDPVSKLTWDNAAYVSVATAERQGWSLGSRIAISAGGRSLEAAVWPTPGMADDSIRLHLGYGRALDGLSIAKDAGFNAYALRTSDALHIASSVNVSDAAGRYDFAHTQDHGTADALKPSIPFEGVQERLPTLVRDDTLPSYREHPDFAKHRAHVTHRLSLWEESNLEGGTFRWAMSIDLSACTGCSACVVACQAENNIPVVGKEQVIRGREMHWMRIDRYFSGHDAAKPDSFLIQPMACQHCENAPCEQVCPVAATSHDKDGLNVMVYNRCIGTRYCSNNCPYKVRRFNFFDWHRKDPARETGIFVVKPDYYVKDGPADLVRMQFNPDVTVRSRGVMEKCTFCLQRIQKAKITHKNAWAAAGGARPEAPTWSIPDGSFTTACAEACPTKAIVFGDLNDPKSAVAKLHREARSYELLEELNTKPRLRYLAKVRNPSVSEAKLRRGSGHDHHHGHDHDHDHDHDHGHKPPGHTQDGAVHGAASVAAIVKEVLA